MATHAKKIKSLSQRIGVFVFALLIAVAASAQISLSDARNLSDSQLHQLLLDEIGQDRYENFADYRVDKDLSRKARRLGITESEMVGLLDYTAVGYRVMNICLREHMSEESCQETVGVIEAARRALSRMPNYRGTVSRTATLPREALGIHVPGAILTYDSFTSTSIAPERLYGSQRFIIESKTGKDISWASEIPKENEVLFAPGTVFKVISVEPSTEPGIQVTIHMQEL